MVVDALAALLTRTGSAVVADTLAWFVIVPPEDGTTLISTLAFAPFAMVPSGHVTVPADCEQLPCAEVADWKVTPLGSVSVTDTPVAADGPALLTPKVYVSSCPDDTGSGASDFVIERSATGFTVVAAPAELLAGVGSLTLEDTLAVFVIVPVDWGVTLIWTLAPAPLAMVPSGHVTVPPDCEQLPCDDVADLNVTPLGSVSLMLTPVALEGPALPTSRV
jgi:hypothetical protein